jgi:hypothetical protein
MGLSPKIPSVSAKEGFTANYSFGTTGLLSPGIPSIFANKGCAADSSFDTTGLSPKIPSISAKQSCADVSGAFSCLSTTYLRLCHLLN